MEKHFWEQLARVDRLLEIVRAPDPYRLIDVLSFYDIVIFACQSMWHLKDWVLNDQEFQAKDVSVLKREIHSQRCLLICADLANGSKHLVLEKRGTTYSFSDRSGIHIEPAKGIYQEYYYVGSSDTGGPCHWIEIRDLLAECRSVWQEILDRHHLSKVDI